MRIRLLASALLTCAIVAGQPVTFRYEQVAIAMLQDLVNTFAEDFDGFHFTRVNGTPVTIVKR